MAKEPKPRLIVQIAPNAAADLAEIWHWNAEHYSLEHANRYLAFLKQVILALDVLYWRGKIVDVAPDFRHILVRRKRKRHGHVVVYRFDDSAVDVLFVFHSAQNWQARLVDEKPNG